MWLSYAELVTLLKCHSLPLSHHINTAYVLHTEALLSSTFWQTQNIYCYRETLCYPPDNCVTVKHVLLRWKEADFSAQMNRCFVRQKRPAENPSRGFAAEIQSAEFHCSVSSALTTTTTTKNVVCGVKDTSWVSPGWTLCPGHFLQARNHFLMALSHRNYTTLWHQIRDMWTFDQTR